MNVAHGYQEELCKLKNFDFIVRAVRDQRRNISIETCDLC